MLFTIVLFSLLHTAIALDSQPNQVHISYGFAPNDIYVTWNTYAQTKTSTVQYTTDFLNYHTVTGTQAKFIQGTNTQFVSRVLLSALNFSTRYFYRVGDDLGGWSNMFYFKTVPYSNFSPKFAVFGDMGLTNARSLPYLQRMAQDNEFDAVLHVGDFGYDLHDQNGEIGDQFMNGIEPAAAHMPYMTAVGNHESYHNYSNYKNRFTMPAVANDNFYYNFTLGDACFIAYSTEFYFTDIKAALVQFVWLNQTLQQQKCPWIITYGHRPMYCSNSEHDDCSKVFSFIRMALEQLFYDNHVDIAIAAHEHSFEITTRMFNNKTDPTGMYHIVSGSAGCKERHDPFKHKVPPWSVFRSIDYGFGMMEIKNATHVHWRQYSVDHYPKKVIYEQWLTK